MKQAVLLVLVLVGGAASAVAQPADRFEIAAVVRNDRVSFEGGEHAQLPVTGFAAGYRVWSDLWVEGELTTSSGQSSRSYEGDFISYASEGATREEILRMAVFARRTNVHNPGVGGSIAITVQSSSPGRVNAMLRAGVSVRQYQYIQTTTILRVPEGVTFEKAAASMPDGGGHQGRGGLLFGVAVPVRIFMALHVAPEARLVWGGPARVGNNYDEVSAGARLLWKF